MLSHRLAPLWLSAATVSSIATWMLYDARPGLNFFLWTSAAVLGLFFVLPERTDRRKRQMALPVCFAVLLAGGAGVTSDSGFHALIVLTVASLLGLCTLLAAAPPEENQYGPGYILTAPFTAFGRTAAGCIRTCIATFDTIGTGRLSPMMRGALVAAPVAIIFALLFASADPLFARGRDAIGGAFATLVALPYWNGDAWIARRNLDRFARTGRIDAAYLGTGLSPDAYPTLVTALPLLPEPTRTEVSNRLTVRAPRALGKEDAWYEWNWRRRNAREALAALQHRMQ
ncbi:MAG: DUF4153 domain-containing protein [Gemmatimonadaceae bacterium]